MLYLRVYEATKSVPRWQRVYRCDYGGLLCNLYSLG